MNSTTKITDFDLSELAAGTLSKERFRQVLFALEASPERWKDCAIAFLQEQALSADLRALADEKCMSKPRFARQQLHDLALAGDPVISSKPAARVKSTGQIPATKWLSLAAMILLSFSIGWSLAETRTDSNDPLGAVAQQESASPPTEPRFVERQQDDSSMDAAGRVPPDQGLVRFVSDSFPPPELSLPDELQDLEQRGHVRIKCIEGVMPLNSENGSSRLLQVQQFQVEPIVFAF